MKKRHLVFSILACAMTHSVMALPKLSPLFSDHMVIQQQTSAPIWGTASPKKTVVITPSWNNEKITVKADTKGEWKAVLKTPQAGGPYNITISDGKSIVLKDILIGEVWLCSGQSNMEFPVKGWSQVLNADQEVAEANHKNIRLLQIHKVTAEEPSHQVVANSSTWQECSSQSVPEFSAVAYFFARELNQKTGIPVGVIDATWGGSNIESWISKNTLQYAPQFADSIARKDYHPWRNSPTALWNGMIQPLVPMALKGFCWYQGEQNELRGYEYRDLFPLLINDWRKQWGKEDLPFYFVQLANFHARKEEPTEALWAEMREAQEMALHVKNTGMVITADIGEGDNVHYPNKQEVGRRLALIALSQCYHAKDAIYMGPRYLDYTIDGNKIVLKMQATGGLQVKGDKLKNFTIAGADHKFHQAEAKIEGNNIVVWSKEVPFPLAVRYAWQDNPDIELFNKFGLPACTFRTDDWPGLSFGKNRLNSEY